MRAYRAQAEFRRRDRTSGWVLAGVVVEGSFWPAQTGVEPLRGRLPQAGLVGWVDLACPIIAAHPDVAAGIALDEARATWPRRVRPEVPYAAGVG